MRRILIGVGNPTRGDDAAGLEVAKRVRTIPSSQQVNGSYELIEIWDGVDEVIIVDAARSGAQPGTLHRFDASVDPLPTGVLAASTHAVGVSEVVEMARTLGRLPARTMVYGIEASDLDRGAGLSAQVERAVFDLVEEIDRA
jgi:hydrogenase maturation protease